ncbi:hypothetical protein [Desulfonatronum thioautotrophicum]|uniref:hypothetical protein n=1 Tax=Desulfonatronum thioautotrophicum TaxID=617001 RepID=UPI0005EBF33C|nr:hypothetical protein [Desulfonatronum thioautotrophicum]
MALYTSILRESAGLWVALCLENGLVGQGKTKEETLLKMKEDVDSLLEVQIDDPGIQDLPISIRERHVFLTVEGFQAQPLEMRTVYAQAK